MLNKKLLQDAQQVVAAGLLGQGVKVVYDTDTPYADLKNRVMHLRPLPEEVNAETMLHLRADCDHEMGHFLCSHPDALDSVRDPLLRILANAIEDGFVERIVSRRWFGCGENLRDSNASLIADLVDNGDGSRDHVRRLALTALQMLTFGYSRSEVIHQLGPAVEEDLEAIADLIPELQGCDNTHDSVSLAREVDRRWWWTDPERPEGSSGSGEEAQHSEDDEQSGGGGGGSDESGGGGGDSEQSDPEPSTGGSGDATRRDLAKRLSEGTLSAARKKAIADTRFKASQYFARTDDDVVERIEVLADAPTINAFVDSVRSVVPTLRRRLLMEFRGVGAKREFDKKAGVIDRESIHKVAVGNPRVFTTEVPHAVPDADVTLLVDMSGSMLCGVGRTGLSRIYIASQAAYAFSTVLDLIGVPNEVLGFTTTMYDDFPFKLGHYTRVRPLRQLVVKPASSSARACKASFASMAAYSECSENVDGECVMWAAQRLAARNRKGMAPILIVLSDGEPASTPERHTVLNTHLLKTVKRIERAGVNVIGVGIQTRSVQKFYKNNIVIGDVKDLVGTSYGILRSVLRTAKRAV